MNQFSGLIHTSIGQKLVLAGSGLALIGFLLAHMLGNMTVFQGREVMNAYAAWLQGHPLLWGARIGLLSVFVVHVGLALRLAAANRGARPMGYVHPRRFQEATFFSRYIVLTGLLVLSFLIYHILHFTLGAVQNEHYGLIDLQGRHDVYGMLVRSFQDPWVAGSYGVAMCILGVHLFHGIRALFQTFGFHHAGYDSAIRAGSAGLAAAVALGNLAIPVSIWLGWLSA